MLILYAEDDPEDADVFCDIIKSINSRIGCLVARDGREALSVLENAIVLPDYIFLDVNMPLLGGTDCLRRIKSNKDMRNIPVIIYTTSRRDEDRRDCLRLGASQYIIKPNTVQELRQLLIELLGSDAAA